MADLTENVVRAFDRLTSAEKRLKEAKEDLNEVMDKRNYELVVFTKDHSRRQAEKVVENDSNYIYLMMMYARAYDDYVAALKRASKALGKEEKFNNAMNDSRSVIDQSAVTLNAISYEYDDTKDKLIDSDPFDGKYEQKYGDDPIFAPRPRKNGSSYWSARETDIKDAEAAFSKVVEEEKKNKEFLKNVDKEFGKFLAKNYPMLRRQPGGNE